MVTTNSARVPELASLLKLSSVEKICDPVVEKGTVLPTAAPLALANATIPVQVGGVELGARDASVLFQMFTWAVSELASPMGGKL